MKHSTYTLLKRAHLGDVDKTALLRAQQEETDPFISHFIKLILEKTPIHIPWDVKQFTSEFRSISPRERLDETVVTFLLRTAAIVKEEIYLRTFQKPESFTALMAWVELLRKIMYAVITLIYNISWKDSDFFLLDQTVLDLLHHGKASALRELMQTLGIQLSRENDLYLSERMFEKINFLHVGQFSAFYWRLLHWMAEAINIRNEQTDAKKMWKELVIGPLYRTLRCGVCMIHLREMVKQMKTELLDDNEDYAKLWFQIHNKVHTQRREQYPFLATSELDYSEEEYKEDAEFMRQALSQL